MENLLNNPQTHTYKRAKQRVKALKGFYYHVLTYCLVIPFLIFINYKTYWGVKWFVFSAIGWGIGLAMHAYRVYSRNPILGQNWEKRKIEQFMREEVKQ